MSRELVLGEWKLYSTGLMNAHEKFNILESEFIPITNILQSESLQKLEEGQLEIIAISEKCMVLQGELGVYTLLRNP